MTITINDPLETLTAQQATTLQVKAAAYPFDIRLTIVSNLSSKPLFESQVAAMVDGPHVLAIGVDPQHHFTHVRGSADLGLPNGPEVAAAGNRYFRKGDLVTGIDSIAARANDLRVSAKLVSSQSGDPIIVHQHQTAVVVWWILGATMVLTAVTLVYLWLRNRKRERDLVAQTAAAAEEAAELRGRNLEEGVWHERMRGKAETTSSPPLPVGGPSGQRAPYQAPAPSYTPFPSPSPTPIIVNSPAPNNSGLDMLIGYELGRSESPRVVERETVIVEPDRSGSGSSWSGDSGSSSSTDWGSSSDSSSSSDWGGGSDSGSSGGGGDW